MIKKNILIILMLVISLFSEKLLWADISLVNEGVASTVIVIPENVSDIEVFAAQELQDYLEKISDVKIQIIRENAGMTGNQIHIGHTVLAQRTIDSQNRTDEEFQIKTGDHTLLLTGNDDRGTLFAVYSFLEKYLAVRWFWPGELGQVVPHKKTITLGDLDDRQSPDYLLRRIAPGLSGPPKQPGPIKKIGNRTLEDNELWCLRNKLGGSVDYGGHTHDFGYMVPPAQYGPTHPEYFALVNGKRTWENFDGKHGCQLCTTNPEVIRLCIEYVRQYFDQHPEMAAVSISPNDGGGFCECDRCRALDAAANNAELGAEVTEDDAQKKTAKTKDLILTDRIFTFANEIARAVRQSHPDKSVLILAYAQYVEPPVRVKPEKNIWVQLCLNSDFLCDDKFYRKRMGQFDRWVTMTDNLLLYDYFSWRGGPDLPRGTSSLIETALRKYQQAGIRKFFTQSCDNFGAEGIDYYVAAKLLWNTNLDARKILDDYCDKCFGPASAPMREWFSILDQRWRYAVGRLGTYKYAGSAEYAQTMFPPEIRQGSRDLFSQAKSQTDPEIRNRILFFEKEFLYLERTLDFIDAIGELEKAGLIQINTGYRRIGKVLPPEKAAIDSAQARKLAEKALQTWQKREEIVEQIKDEHIIDYWHIRNNVDRDYKFNPVEKLNRINEAYKR
jgi:hypothetical protein